MYSLSVINKTTNLQQLHWKLKILIINVINQIKANYKYNQSDNFDVVKNNIVDIMKLIVWRMKYILIEIVIFFYLLYFQIEILEGKQNGSILYVYHNYTYCKDNRYDHIYRCTKRKSERCSGIIEKKGECYNLKHRHNHSEERYIIEIYKMKKEMIRLCKETTLSFKVIFDTVCRTNLLAGAHISYSNMKSIFCRERAKSRPKIPNDLRSLHQ